MLLQRKKNHTVINNLKFSNIHTLTTIFILNEPIRSCNSKFKVLNCVDIKND